MLGRIIHFVELPVVYFLFVSFFTMLCSMNVKYLDIINTVATNSFVPTFHWTHGLIFWGGVYHLGAELIGGMAAINFLRNSAVRNIFDRLCIRLG